MRGYGQFCPIAKASEVLGERWTHLVIRELIPGESTFNEIRRTLPLISPTLLSTRLKSLESVGVIYRKDADKGVVYGLTESGLELKPIIMQLGVWGHRWVRSDLSDEDLDPSVLVWDIRRNIDVGFFEKDRTVIKIEFSNYSSKMRMWWLVVAEGDADVCLKDPGYDVDITIKATLKDLTAIWMGDLALMKALREDKLQLTGSTDLKKNIGQWLGRNYFADVKPAFSRND